MDKSKFIKFFTYGVITLVLLFLVDLFLGNCIFGLKPLIFQNFHDYMADFFNHARLASQANVYISSNEIEIAERGLSPIEYVIFSKISRIADFNSIPTILFNGASFDIAKSKAIYCANYFTCAISILFFIFLFDKLKIQSKIQKYFIIFAFVFSAPFIHYFERGNTVLLSVFAVSYFLFNYNFYDSRREEKRRDFLYCSCLCMCTKVCSIPIFTTANC